MIGNEYMVLDQVMFDHQITIKQLESWTGYDDKHLYQCRCGGRLISPLVWRVLYAKTQDARIPQIITGDEPVMLVQLDGQPWRPDAATLKKLLAARREEIEFESQVLAVLEDGKIDAMDRAAVVEINNQFPKMIQTLSQIYAAVVGEYEKNGKKLHNSLWLERQK
jgi:hypothetical protein